eukprot:SAG25_NODE_2120_length_1927_cov_1.352298_1_plen_187_part_00
MQHLLNVGAVQKTTGSGRDTNMAVQLPPWSITLKATSEDTDVQDHTQEISLPPEARSDTIEFTSPTMGLETPQGVIQVANESDLPRGSVLCIYTIVHQAGVEGATAKYITEQFAAAQATEEIRRLANACLANQCLDLLSDRANIARVSAWDHHRYVSTACDHLWSLAGRGTPGVTFLFLIVPAVPI